jgi:hypothetical protein
MRSSLVASSFAFSFSSSSSFDIDALIRRRRWDARRCPRPPRDDDAISSDVDVDAIVVAVMMMAWGEEDVDGRIRLLSAADASTRRREGGVVVVVVVA